METETKARRYWLYKHLPPEEVERLNAERQAAHLARQAEIAERRAAEAAAEEKAKNKILALLDQRPIWDSSELRDAVGIVGTPFNHALGSLHNDGKLVHAAGSTVHRKTKELMTLRREARKAVGAYPNTCIEIIPDSNAAPVKSGEPSSDYNLRKYGKYNPSTLQVTVGQYWLAPVVEAIAKDYAYDA